MLVSFYWCPLLCQHPLLVFSSISAFPVRSFSKCFFSFCFFVLHTFRHNFAVCVFVSVLCFILRGVLEISVIFTRNLKFHYCFCCSWLFRFTFKFQQEKRHVFRTGVVVGDREWDLTFPHFKYREGRFRCVGRGVAGATPISNESVAAHDRKGS